MNEIERAKLKRTIKYFKNECKWYAKSGWGSDEDAIACEVALTLCRAELSRQENAPLTIEEVISMNGKPVWCQTGDGYEGWALVIVDNYPDGGHYLYLFSDDLTRDGINEAFEPDEDFYNLTFSDDPNGHFGLHVLGWRAYRYEPKGEKE